MVARFSTKDVLEAAVKIEREASGFYAAAAKQAGAGAAAKLLGELSAMEAEHAALFEGMLGALTEKEKAVETSDPGNEMLYYLQTSATMHGWEGKKGPTGRLTGRESLTEILENAIAAEKEAVFFYTGVRDLVPGDAGREKVEKVLREEMRHVAQLSRMLAETKD